MGKYLWIFLVVMMLLGCRDKIDQSTLRLPELYASSVGSVVVNPQGRIILVIFFDFADPASRQLFPELMKIVQSNKDVRLIYRVLPMSGTNSSMVARFAIAAQAQEHASSFQNALFLAESPLTRFNVLNIAEQAGLNVDQLIRDAASPSVGQQINENLDLAHKLQITSVPVYVLAIEGENDNIVTADLMEGEVSHVQLLQMIAQLSKKTNR